MTFVELGHHFAKCAPRFAGRQSPAIEVDADEAHAMIVAAKAPAEEARSIIGAARTDETREFPFWIAAAFTLLIVRIG